MNKKEKELFRLVLQIHSRIISIMDDENYEKIYLLLKNLDSDFQNLSEPKLKEGQAFWRTFAKMSDEDILAEFSDPIKYPTIESIKEAMRGILDMSKVSKVKTRETLIEHILRVKHKDDYIRGIIKNVNNNTYK